MGEHDTGQITRRLAELRSRMESIGPIMRGSVTFMGARHKQPYFSVSVGGKSRVMYLGAERAEPARRCVENYRKLTALVDEMTLLRMQLLKGTAPSRPKANQAPRRRSAADTKPKH